MQQKYGLLATDNEELTRSIFLRETPYLSIAELDCRLAYVASVSVWFRSKEDRGTGFSVLAAREMKQEPRSFTCAIFRAVFDTCSSFSAPKPHGNACYAG